MLPTKIEIESLKEFMMLYKFALKEINTKLTILNEEFQLMHDYNPIEHIKSRIKSPQSMITKLERKGYAVTVNNAKEYINDIAGVRITCSFTKDIYTIFDMLAKQKDITVIQIKDYIKNPKPNGYKSLHLIVEIPIFLTNRTEKVKVEIQIRTIAMDFWASLEHKIYYKFQEKVPDSLLYELKNAADMVHYLDNKMNDINEKMDIYKDLDDKRTGSLEELIAIIE